MRRIAGVCRRARHDFDPHAAKEALSRLLGPRDYAGDGCSVVPYGPALLSLPKVTGKCVPISDVLDLDARSVIRDFEHRILADDEHLARQRATEVGAYMDTEMRKERSLYLRFLATLAERGLLAGARRGRITPFCVRKKGGRQRLVFDCRKVNCGFKSPPR